MRGRVVRVQLDGAAEFDIGLAEAERIGERHAARGMSFGQRAIELKSFAAGFVTHGLSLFGADANAVAGSDVVGVGQSDVGEGVVGIGGDGLLEEVDAFLQARRRASVPELAAFEIKAIGFGIAGSGLAEFLLLRALLT